MSAQTQAIIGAAVLLAGWLLSSWAARCDVKGWITDAIWRGIFGGGLKAAAKGDLKGAVASDGELRRQIGEKVDAFNADAARLGKTRAAAKHGVRYALAYSYGLIAGPIMLVGLLVLGHAAHRLWN